MASNGPVPVSAPRTTRQVSLTPAGEVLLRDARTALDAVAAATRRARQAGQPEPVLRLALKADYDGGLLPQILAEYQREAAAFPVELVLGGRGEQLPALRDGRADIALLATPFDDGDRDIGPLLTEPRLVALAADDPLALRRHLHLADLAGRTLPDGTPADRGGLSPTTAPAGVCDGERPQSEGHRSPAVAAFVRTATAVAAATGSIAASVVGSDLVVDGGAAA